MNGAITYIVDEDAILTYADGFAHELDIAASARALATRLEMAIGEQFPGFVITVKTDRGPVAREVSAWADDPDWSTDEIERAVCAYVEDVWFHDAEKWLVSR